MLVDYVRVYEKVLIKIFLFLAITNSAHASYLRSAGKYIFTSEGEKIIQRMGLGGWLVREGYMLQTPGLDLLQI